MNMDTSTLWILAGVILLVTEMMTAGFFIFFIALGCFAGALMASFGFSYVTQGLSFAAVTAGGIFLLRKPIQKKLLKTSTVSSDLGKEIKIEQMIEPQGQTRINYQGTSWQANNLDSEAILPGDRVVVVGMDGNILLIRKLH